MKTINKAYCEICEYETPQTEVICVDLVNDESWTEPRCQPCFDWELPWEERWG